jgi:two-component system chemotaxis response regulator CheB
VDELLSEFLSESHENLSQLDLDLVELEKDPTSAERLASVFRTFHTMKGVAGFLNFSKLEALAHAAEDLLSRLRDGELVLDAPITSSLLAAVDAVRRMLAVIAAQGDDGDSAYAELIESLAVESLAAVPTPPPAYAGAAKANGTAAAVDPARSRRRRKAEAEAPDGVRGNAKAIALEAGTAEDVPAAQSVEPLRPSRDDAARAPANAPARDDGGEPAAVPAAHDSTIRVNVHLLDKVMNLVGELVLVRNQVLQFASGSQESAFVGASQRLNLITTELQEGIMKTRMQPIGTIWSKFQRIVRDLALACDKQVRIAMEGEETELDKTLIEAIRDPLTHVVRNAIDHGIETPEARVAAGKPELLPFEVVGVAAHGKIALAMIPQLNPDAVILDIEMPEMNGLQTLAALRPRYPSLPVIMFSTLSARGATATLDALELGANDYVLKPSNAAGATGDLAAVTAELVRKLRLHCLGALGAARPPSAANPAQPALLAARPAHLASPAVVAIGVSTGGPNALGELLPAFPADLPVPLLIVQHMPRVFTKFLADRLASKSLIPVREASVGDQLEPGNAWIAPGDFHMTIKRAGAQIQIDTNQEPPENSCRPAVDVLFRSVAAVYGPRALAVVMTGMGQDGLRGCETIRRNEGRVIVQDERSSVVWGMPGAVAQAGLAEAIVPLKDLAEVIMRRLGATAGCSLVPG